MNLIIVLFADYLFREFCFHQKDSVPILLKDCCYCLDLVCFHLCFYLSFSDVPGDDEC